MVAKALLIEDQKFISQIYTIVLKGAGHTVVNALDGKNGLALLESETPDVVITDVDLPDVSGLDLIGIIQGKGVPVIVITGGSSSREEDYLGQALQKGAVAALLKPVTAENLLAALGKALKQGAAMSARS